MKTSSFGYLVKEGTRSLWVNRLMSTAAIGVLAACLAENKDMEESVRCATRAAAITITRYGAQQSIPYREEV